MLLWYGGFVSEISFACLVAFPSCVRQRHVEYNHLLKMSPIFFGQPETRMSELYALDGMRN